MSGTLDDLLGSRRPSTRVCFRCGAPAAAVALVMVRRVVNGQAKGPSKSVQRTFCEPHAVETYERCADVMDPPGDERH